MSPPAVEARKFSSTAQRLKIGQHVQAFLCRLIGTAIKEPRIRRHDGIRHHKPRIVEMSELPVAGMEVEFARQSGPMRRVPQSCG